MKHVLVAWTKRQFVQNTFWSLAGQGLGTLIRGAYFAVLAAALGAEQYGAFAAALAVVSILNPLAPLGTGYVLVQNVARQPGRLPTAWGNALLVTSVAATAMTALLITFHSLIFPPSVPVLLLGLTALAQILLASLSFIAGQAFQAVQRLDRTALLQVLDNLTKLIAAIFLSVTASSPSARHWSGLYFLSALITAVIAVALVYRELGAPRLAPSRIAREVADGAYFAVGGATEMSYHELDKVLLARLSTLEATGVYAASQRLIEIAFIPIRSMLVAALAKFFQQGAHGIRSSVGLARRVAPVALGYALSVGVVLFVSAPLVPLLFGADYQSAVIVIRWIAVIPLLKTVHSLAGHALTGAGYQRLCTYALLAAALTNALANLWLIPRFSWRGAAWSRIATEAMLVFVLWALTWYRLRFPARITALETTEP